MSTREMRVNRVLDIRQDPERHAIQISTDRSGQLWVDIAQFAKDDLQLLATSLTQKRPIVIEFDSQTKQIVWVNYAKVDTIVLLGDKRESEGKVRVHALMRPSPLSLRKDDPRFEELYDLLAEALGLEKKVKVALAIDGDYIVDVVLIEPPPKN
jgi:hypothetical protein